MHQRCSSRVDSLLGVCDISNLVKISREARCARLAMTETISGELPVEQRCSVTSVLTPPAIAVGFNADGRMPFGPDLLSQVLEDGRFGRLDVLRYFNQGPGRAVIAPLEAPARYLTMLRVRAKVSPTVGVPLPGRRS